MNAQEIANASDEELWKRCAELQILILMGRYNDAIELEFHRVKDRVIHIWTARCVLQQLDETKEEFIH